MRKSGRSATVATVPGARRTPQPAPAGTNDIAAAQPRRKAEGRCLERWCTRRRFSTTKGDGMARRVRRARWLGIFTAAALIALAIPVWASGGGNAGADKTKPGEEAQELEEGMDAFYEARTAPSGSV